MRNHVFLHSFCPGADWLIQEVRNGVVVESFAAPFSQNGYFFEYVGRLVTVPVEWPNRPYLVTLHVKFFQHLLDAYAKAATAAKAAKERRDKAAMQAGETLSQIPGITSSDAWL